MDRFPGHLVLAGAIMIAGGALSPRTKADEMSHEGVIAMAIGCIVAVMGLIIGYFALRAMADRTRAQDHDRRSRD